MQNEETFQCLEFHVTERTCHKNHARRVVNSAFCLLHSTFSPAFTLIELIITTAVAGIAILALVMAFQASLQNLERQRALQSANLLAEDLLSEIRSKKYVDPQFPTNFGPETWTGETNRLYFDDVDDYDNCSESPPRTIEGADLTNLTGFAWRAIVANVPATNFNSPPAAENSTDFKRITVLVSNAVVAVSNMTVVGRFD